AAGDGRIIDCRLFRRFAVLDVVPPAAASGGEDDNESDQLFHNPLKVPRGFAPADSPTASLAGAPESPLRSAELARLRSLVPSTGPAGPRRPLSSLHMRLRRAAAQSC